MPVKLSEKIVSFIKINGQARPNDLVRAFSPISRVSVHKQLKKLVNEGTLQKNGQPPVVFYVLKVKSSLVSSPEVPEIFKRIIEQNYLYITPQGEIITGIKGFFRWAANTKQTSNVAQLAQIYAKSFKEFNRRRKPEGWIDATFKLKQTFSHVYLNKLLYADFYSLPQFGKTKLGSLMLYGKQSQNRELIKNIGTEIKPLVKKIIKDFQIEAVAFIPPSIPRNIQFMNELAMNLALSLPKINLIKTKTGQVIVAQKTLEKLEERLVNARETIFVKETNVPYKKILLVDDAVGSGASMNETAKKLKELQKIPGRIIGFAIVGSLKGFEVIREV